MILGLTAPPEVIAEVDKNLNLCEKKKNVLSKNSKTIESTFSKTVLVGKSLKSS